MRTTTPRRCDASQPRKHKHVPGNTDGLIEAQIRQLKEKVKLIENNRILQSCTLK